MSLQAGTAKSEITTTQPGIRVLDPLWAKALVLKDDSTTVALITLDALAIGGIGDVTDDFLPQLRERLHTQLGIPVTNVLVNASHTHPPGQILCEPDVLLDRVFDAVRRAASVLQPVTVGAGQGSEDRISMNRNLILEDGRHWTIRHAHPNPPEPLIAGTNRIDPEIGVIRLDRPNGPPLAIIYNFACHLLFADYEGSVTANIPGIASAIIENHYGDSTTAFFLQGAAGDVIDIGFKDFTQPRDITPYGTRLGLSTLKAAQAIRTTQGPLNLLQSTPKLPLRTDIPARIEKLRGDQSALLSSLRYTTLDFQTFLPLYFRQQLNPSSPSNNSYQYLWAEENDQLTLKERDNFLRAHTKKYLQSLQTMEQLARIEDEIATFHRHLLITEDTPGDTVPAEVLGLRLGDAAIITAPMELLTEIGLNLKAASPFETTLVAAFTNGYLHYGAPAADYDKGGYEVTECLLAPEWQAIYENTAQTILREL